MSRKKYHISPDGEPRKCIAAPGNCDYAVDGVDPEHFSTKKAAREAYNSQKESDKEYLEGLKKNTPEISSDDNLLINNLMSFTSQNHSFTEFDGEPNDEELMALLEDFNDEDIYFGMTTEYYGIDTIEGGKQAQEMADNLVLELTDFEGNFDPPEEKVAYWGKNKEGKVQFFEKEEFAGDFELLGSGEEKNAYLHRESGLVFKVPNFNSVKGKWTPDNMNLEMKALILDQQAYASLNNSSLEEENIEYVKTYFFSSKDLNGNEVPIVVQPYLDPDNYEQYSMDKDLQKKLKNNHNLDDLHFGNVRRNKTTGKIVLFDCLYMGLD